MAIAFNFDNPACLFRVNNPTTVEVSGDYWLNGLINSFLASISCIPYIPLLYTIDANPPPFSAQKTISILPFIAIVKVNYEICQDHIHILHSLLF